MKAMLVLEDGTVFRGESVGAEGFAFGEAVFTTAMTGYQEVVTDPSYAEQVVCFTAPMIGNYGVTADRCESSRPHARAVVMRDARGPGWTDWLHEHGLVALSGIDTRSLVTHLREAGAMRAIAVAGEASVTAANARKGLGRRCVHGGSVRLQRCRCRADRGRRLRLQAIDPPAPGLGGRRRHGLPARRRPG
jgi:carbamoyl-phosphate synthase small subunit